MKLTLKQRLTGKIPDPQPAKGAPYPIGTFIGMDAAAWFKSDAHILWAREMFKEPKFKDLLAVLSNSRPRRVPSGVSDVDACITLGEREGYDRLLGLLLTLPEFPKKEEQQEVPMTYGAENFQIDVQ